jgi:spore coat polysaccharide biosynthesis protein SpsF
MCVLAIIQARVNSQRLPGKVLLPLGKYTVLEHVIFRTLQCKLIDRIVLATTTASEDDEIETLGKKWNMEVFRGSKEPLTRFWEVATSYKASHIIRIKADCPAIDPKVVDFAIKAHLSSQADYTTNTLKRTYPVGYDVEILSFKALRWLYENSLHPVEREHITLKLEKFTSLKTYHLLSQENLNHLRLTIDYPEDYELMQLLFKHLYSKNSLFGLEEVKRFFSIFPEVAKINSYIPVNAGVLKDLKCREGKGYPNGWEVGIPHDYYTEEDADEAISGAEEIIRFCKNFLVK